MQIADLLHKYKDIKYEPPSTLFEVDWRVAYKGFCPLCLRKLSEMRDKPFMYCRAKTHKKFIISKSKIPPSLHRISKII